MKDQVTITMTIKLPQEWADVLSAGLGHEEGDKKEFIANQIIALSDNQVTSMVKGTIKSYYGEAQKEVIAQLLNEYEQDKTISSTWEVVE